MREGGYSLLEVLVAMVILTVCIVPMAGMFDSAVNAAGAAAKQDIARAEAGRALEGIRALGYEEAAAEYPPGAPKACPKEAAEESMLCTVETSYVDGDLEKIGAYGTRMIVSVEVAWDGASYDATGFIAAGEP